MNLRRLARATVIVGIGVLLSGGALGGQTVVTPPQQQIHARAGRGTWETGRRGGRAAVADAAR